MSFIPYKEVQKAALINYQKNVEASFAELVDLINLNIEKESENGNFSVTLDVTSFYTKAVRKAKELLEAEGYTTRMSNLGDFLTISWDAE